MVGRLVEQKHVGFFEKKLAQGDSPALSAGQGAHVRVWRREAKGIHRDLDPPVQVPGVGRVDPVLEAGLLCDECLHLVIRHRLGEFDAHLLELLEKVPRLKNGLFDVAPDIELRVEFRLLGQIADFRPLGPPRPHRGNHRPVPP